MRLVDAVDAMADNRGELLFELRGATQRQFALYRVLRGQARKAVCAPGRAGLGRRQANSRASSLLAGRKRGAPRLVWHGTARDAASESVLYCSFRLRNTLD